MSGDSATVPAVTVPDDIAKRIRSAAQRISRGTAERDQAIIDAAEAGGSLREIAALAGITHVGVMKIIRRRSVTESTDPPPDDMS